MQRFIMAKYSSGEFKDCHDDSDADDVLPGATDYRGSPETPPDASPQASDETCRHTKPAVKRCDLEKFTHGERDENGGTGGGGAKQDDSFFDCNHSDGELNECTEQEQTLVPEGSRNGLDGQESFKDTENEEVEVRDESVEDQGKVGRMSVDNAVQTASRYLKDGGGGGGGRKGDVQEDQEMLLLAARHGDGPAVYSLIRKYEDLLDRAGFSVNCKGQQKSNRGWTPLHLASYFGHEKVVLILLTHGGDVNAVNPTGDTPLHKAAYIGREDLVQILIEHGADVFALNSEGRSPRDVAYGEEVQRLIQGAEQSQDLKSHRSLLEAASEGDVEMLTKLLNAARPPDINCHDDRGNTPLHRASCSDKREAAILLLQGGAKTGIKNSMDQTPLDLAQSFHLRQLLSVRPMKVIHSYVNKFEGPLYRAGLVRRRHLWVVLDQGMLTYYRNRADAYAGVKRQGYKSLEGAEIRVNIDDPKLFSLKYHQGPTHLWMLDEKFSADLDRAKWISALREHRSYCERLANSKVIADSSDSEDEDEGPTRSKKLLPLNSIHDIMKNAQTRQQLLEESIRCLTQWTEGLKGHSSANGINPTELQQKLQDVLDRSHAACDALSSCMTVMSGQEELRNLQLKQEQERTRNLQDALHALARQHDRLELLSASLSTSPRNHYTGIAQEFDYHFDDHEFLSVRGDSDSGSGGGSPAGSFFDVDDDDDRLSDVESFYSVRMDTGQDRMVAEGVGQLRISDSENHSNNKQSEEEGVVPCSSQNGGHNGRTKREGQGKDVFTFGDVPEIIIPGCTRARLPAPMYRRDHVTLWTVLKQCIGKELSKITMPVVFNEPLSFLQRCCEYIEHAHLLVKANMSDDAVDRMKLVTAFVVSASASNVDRFGKPFNPLLGETYELKREDIDTRILLEQVSHHPPVSAFHATSPHFEFHGAVHPKLKFWGKSMEVQPKGVVTIKLPKHGESYTFHNVLMCVHNLIVGRLWIEQYGTLEIINHKTGHKSTLNFKPAGWFGRDLHKIEGHITDKRGNKLCYLYGKWTEYICAVETGFREGKKEEKRRRGKVHASERSPPTSPGADSFPHDDPDNDAQILWQNLPRPADSSQYYSFTSFAMKLNELDESTKTKLPCTDSRLRPDIRLLENGDIDGASSEKHRLEENQRARRKLRNKNKETWMPLWFRSDVNSLTGESDWVYRGNYWDQNYSMCPEIF